MKRKIIRSRFSVLAAIGCFCWVLLFLMSATLYDHSSAAPGLKFERGSNNTLLITLTNTVPNEYYEIQQRPDLLSAFPWNWHMSGTNGQTNFTIIMGPGLRGFYRAAQGTDFDQDGIPNWQDARPLDSNYGILTITIESPANGSTIQ